MRLIVSTWVVGFLLASNPAIQVEAADDLRSLTREYRSGVKKVGGAPKDRAAKVKKFVAPVLEKIAAVDSDASLQFLVGELKKALPEIAAACAAPALKSSNSKAPALVLSDFSRRPPVVQTGILKAVAASERDFSSASKQLLATLRARLRPEVLAETPKAVGKLDSVSAAKALIGAIKAPRRGSTAGNPFADSVVEALKKTKSDDVKAWLGGKALSTASRDPAKAAAVLKLIAALGLEDARSSVVSMISNKNPAVAAAAVAALSKIGIGRSVSKIKKALQRSRGVDFQIEALDALAASGSDEALEIVFEFASSKDPESRAIAMGSLASVASTNERALKALGAGLRDEDSSVQAVALRSLARIKHKAMISPLIEALNEESPHSVRVKALELLVARTGQNMGLVRADWKKWWEIAEPKFKFKKEKKGGKEATAVKAYGLEYFGIEVSSKRLTFIVDISSSMNQEVAVKRRPKEKKKPKKKPSGRTAVDEDDEDDGKGREKLGTKAKKIDILRVELQRVIKKLPADTQINIVTFDARPRAWQKKLQPMRGSGRAKAVKFAKDLRTGRGTNVYDSLEDALKDKRVDTIYLMTDGQPSAGKITAPDAIRKAIRKQNRIRAVTIHCIAFGEQSKFLEELAKDNGGKYRYVDEY
ncbi:MAG: HEAT repeat domain-containing protein [Planctomycetota bacterium]